MTLFRCKIWSFFLFSTSPAWSFPSSRVIPFIKTRESSKQTSKQEKKPKEKEERNDKKKKKKKKKELTN